jgi:transposase
MAAVETGGLWCHRAAASVALGVSTAIRWMERAEHGGYESRAIMVLAKGDDDGVKRQAGEY